MAKFLQLDERLADYVVEFGSRQDDVLARIQAETEAMGEVAVMQISPDQGAFMTLIAQLTGARDALEIGTFTGYSAICIARGLAPGGRLLCCELSDEFAAIAARNFERAGIGARAEIVVGPALDTLSALPAAASFDLVFIDADKVSYGDYFEATLERTRPGGLIVLDNVLYSGEVAAPAGERSANADALDELNRRLATDERIDLAMLAIADGITLARKR
ncbi:O-methyltransferase [Thermoleophilia bacterium SCSIO 60948]|nr:O-methyltransferase [Thermoleophilia bacterium SCSIO 60948]